MKGGLKIGYVFIAVLTGIFSLIPILSIGKETLDLYAFFSLFSFIAIVAFAVLISLDFDKAKNKIKILLALNIIILVVMIALVFGLRLGTPEGLAGALMFILLQIPNTIVLVINLIALRTLNEST